MMIFFLLDQDDPGDALLTRLYVDYYTNWIKYVRYYFKDQRGVSAEDIVNDVFIYMLRHEDDLLGMTENGRIGYISKALQNRCREVWRKKDLPTVPIDDAGQIEQWGADPHTVLEGTILEYRCIQILLDLPPRDRNIVINYYYGFTLAEMQQTFDLQANSMRTQLYRSRQLLRERVREVFKNEYEIHT